MLNKFVSVVLILAAASSLALACSSTPDPARVDPVPNIQPTPDAGKDADAILLDAAHPSCTAMFDIPDESTAEQACQHIGSDCAVCVQAVGAGGVATMWLAQENASVCPCPAVDGGVLVDGGPHADAGPDADAAPLPDAAPTVDGATDAPSCTAMFDIPNESTAEQACQHIGSDCAVCVQALGPGGVPSMWLAQENASVCPCPAVDGGVPVDGGPHHDAGPDAGSHADAAPLPDAAPTVDGATDAPSDASCAATFDIGTKSMAEQICSTSNDCAVCVQNVDAQGNATTWLAQQNASSCPCPAPKP